MLEFDASLYLESAIRQAIEDYREIADIRMTREKDRYVCEIRNPKLDPALILLEFGNYVLNISVMAEGKQNHDLR